MKYLLFIVILQAIALNALAQVKNKNYIEKDGRKWIINERQASWKQVKIELNTVEESRYFLKKFNTSQVIGISSYLVGATFILLRNKDRYVTRGALNRYELAAAAFIVTSLYFQLNSLKQRKKAVMAYNYGNSR